MRLNSRTYSGFPRHVAFARELAVDLQQVSPSGPAGRITAEDVRAFAEQQGKAAEAAPPKKVRPARPSAPPAHAQPDFSRWGAIERVPVRSVRRATAKKLAESWSRIPHVSHHDLTDITALKHLRRDLADEVEDGALALIDQCLSARRRESGA